MAQSYAKLQEKQRFDDLMDFLDRKFQNLPDHRTGNATRYVLADVLKSAFAMFSLKSPSLLDFKKQTDPERSNLRTIYRIKGEIPCPFGERDTVGEFSLSRISSLNSIG
jgi:hypothetical protein